MDKKEVKDKLDKIQRTLDSLRGYNDRINRLVLVLDDCVKSAQEKLSKPDWISVEDELPPYGESVLVTTKSDPRRIVWITSRAKGRGWNIDRNGFLCAIAARITHWRKIDKLEV